MPTEPTVTLNELCYEWPDGSVTLDHLSGVFSTGRTGLIGRNGEGKSTLLRLIAGQLQPTSGVVTTNGDVGYLPQTLTLSTTTRIADLLGISDALDALSAIESGDADPRHFELVGDDWDIAARADAALHEIGLGGADLDRGVTTLSGGEAMLVAITGLRLRRTPITLLDEPTNNLDRRARNLLAELISSWTGTLIVVSHDLELLEQMDRTAELYAGALEVFGGPYSQWRAYREQQNEAAQHAASAAQQSLKASKRQRVEAETTLARRRRTARATQLSGSIPKILAGARENRAQGAAGSLRATLDTRVRAAQADVDAADARVRDDEHIHLLTPDPAVHKGRRLIEFTGARGTIVVQGPERVALLGANGSGKSTLLDHLIKGTPAVNRHLTATLLTDRVGYLSQNSSDLDLTGSAVDNVQSVAPQHGSAFVRDQLARLLLRGDTVDRPVRTLSGGERFRVSLAKLLLPDPPAELLVLDEPTNSLDLDTVEQLAQALDGYRGALLIVSHDMQFLSRIGIQTYLDLHADGQLAARPAD